MIARLAKLPDERGLILGIDKSNIFKPGIVYEVTEILDTIMIRPMGKYSLPENGSPSENSVTDDIVYSGRHLITESERSEMIRYVKERITELEKD